MTTSTVQEGARQSRSPIQGWTGGPMHRFEHVDCCFEPSRVNTSLVGEPSSVFRFSEHLPRIINRWREMAMDLQGWNLGRARRLVKRA
ncbi:uncharacterized protein SPSK_06764 [Sporothrix schenckii 1099-18]|uniref:Uncharacterized protein n=1 Tax=Sporothrix schenckii 1099-18 TaxID=1397361 RepID=A0A0F2MJZ2_SPOSC|nr:uncharacterized protein SPSK_06764 [Sporothrix schenckii 1099-18]KJR89399.1 hypothetical protein SPSK_06764 [Sporothrix schenckii 1099-18]